MRRNILFLALAVLSVVLASCNDAPSDAECEDIISYAENPETGECTEFPTDCTPEGWKECYPVIIIDKPGTSLDKDSCREDSDCVCGGIDALSNECFIGNKEYYGQYVIKSKLCPDFCGGVAGDMMVKCVDSKCVQVSKEAEFMRLCSASGGSWVECGSGCGPLRIGDPIGLPRICPAVCIPQCRCPPNAPFWDDNKGCVSGTDEELENTCEADEECALGIRIGRCCDCPGAYSIFKITYTAKLVEYEPGKDYSRKLPESCANIACAPCLDMVSPRCISGECHLVQEIHGFECTATSGCAPNKCCHATACVPAAEAPVCEGVMCTMDCRTPLDCEAGCKCVEGECKVVPY